MRILLPFLAACGGTKPAALPTPSDPSELHADLVTFCSAEAASHATGLPDLGPFLEPRLRDPEMKELLFGTRDGEIPLEVLHHRLVALTAEQKVAPCPTLDVLFAPRAP